LTLIHPIHGVTPNIHFSCFIAENATLVGDAIAGRDCSFWFNSVVRADVNAIRIGQRTNIQDGAVIHCTYKSSATYIGSNVIIGHNAVVHGCTVADYALIGMGAIVMDHAVVEEYVIVAAGSVVLENSRLESGFMYAGVPAKKIKKISEEQQQFLRRTAGNYITYSSWFTSSQNQS